jgi:hypothetical protein
MFFLCEHMIICLVSISGFFYLFLKLTLYLVVITVTTPLFLQVTMVVQDTRMIYVPIMPGHKVTQSCLK